MNQWWNEKPDLSNLSLEDQFEFEKLNRYLPEQSRTTIVNGYVMILNAIGAGELLQDDEFVISLGIIPKEQLVKIVLHAWVQWRLRLQLLPLNGL